MMGRKAARNMYSRNTNKIEIRCICWFHLQGICHDARSYDLKTLSGCLWREYENGGEGIECGCARCAIG